MAKMTKKVKEQQIDGLKTDLLKLLNENYNEEKCKELATKLIDLGWENAHNYKYCYIVTSQEYEICLNYLVKNGYPTPNPNKQGDE